MKGWCGGGRGSGVKRDNGDRRPEDRESPTTSEGRVGSVGSVGKGEKERKREDETR